MSSRITHSASMYSRDLHRLENVPTERLTLSLKQKSCFAIKFLTITFNCERILFLKPLSDGSLFGKLCKSSWNRNRPVYSLINLLVLALIHQCSLSEEKHVNESSKVCSWSFTFTFIRHFYPKRLIVNSGYTVFLSVCVPWESNPQPLRC